MEEDEENEVDELNVQSEKFNALQALYSTKIVLPFPSAPVLDNVAKATSLLSRNQDLVNKPNPSVRAKKEIRPSTSGDVTDETETETDSKSGALSRLRSHRNVLTRMKETKGPLAFLKACMEKRIRVKVWTRTARGIRGYCLGFLVAFDKHWNLVLEDVQEVWSRRMKRKKYLLGQANEMPIGWKAMGPPVKPPKVVVRKGARGMETCERHVNQMLMRGVPFLENAIPDQMHVLAYAIVRILGGFRFPRLSPGDASGKPAGIPRQIARIPTIAVKIKLRNCILNRAPVLPTPSSRIGLRN